MEMKLKIGDLVAVTGVANEDVVVLIGRIVSDDGQMVTVDSDEEIEGDAAVEHDFPTPEARTMTVPRSRIRPIIDGN